MADTLTPTEILEHARRLTAAGYELWLASNADVLRELDLVLRADPAAADADQLDPAGPAGTGERGAGGGADPVRLTPLDFLGPYERAWKLEDLMRAYNVLNATAFGTKGIPLQNWVMIDLGLLPSGFLLITLSRGDAEQALVDPARSVHERERIAGVLPAVLAEADRLGYEGPIPVAGYCAAPTPDRAAWVGWSLCSAIPGLGTVAKGLGLLAYGARTLTGVTQFYDPALRVHRKFGPMRLLAAVLDLHPVHHTMAYRTEVFAREHADDAEPTLLLDPRDLEAQWALQRRLDAGTHEYFILSPGLVEDRVPILERTV
ncbi:MAG TPA: hypothetical protein VKV21_10960 [Solirubrobacteraceae bacterium]|nr:hypothetical protein [Solirubrobacteraceae bacterium]